MTTHDLTKKDLKSLNKISLKSNKTIRKRKINYLDNDDKLWIALGIMIGCFILVMGLLF